MLHHFCFKSETFLSPIFIKFGFVINSRKINILYFVYFRNKFETHLKINKETLTKKIKNIEGGGAGIKETIKGKKGKKK